MSERKAIVVLEAVFDDSDIQTDYCHRDRPLETYFVCDLEGKMITEAKLRKALEKLPAWLQGLKWVYEKPEKYSMSDHYYGQLRADEGLGLTIRGEHTYGHYDQSVRFLLSTSTIGIFNMNHTIGKPIPKSIEEMRQFVEQKQKEWKEQRERSKEAMRKAHIETIKSSHAIIDGTGFHILTEEEKKKQIEAFTKKCEEQDRYIS